MRFLFPSSTVLDLGECVFRWFSVLVCGACARWRIFINESRAACSWFCGVTNRVKSWILITKFCCSKFPSTRFALDFSPLGFESLTAFFDFDCPSPVFGPSPTGSARAAARTSAPLISAGWTSHRVLPLGFLIPSPDISVSCLDISVSCLDISVSCLDISVSHFVFRFSAAVPFLLFGLSPQSAPASLSELKFPPSLCSYRFPSRR
jgi:hypothetical protein